GDGAEARLRALGRAPGRVPGALLHRAQRAVGLAPGPASVVAHRDAGLRRDIGEGAPRLRVASEAAGRDLLAAGGLEALPALAAALIGAPLTDGPHRARLRPEGEDALDPQLALARPGPAAVGGGEDGGAARGMAARRPRRRRAHREDQVARFGGIHDHRLDVRVLAAGIEGVIARE